MEHTVFYFMLFLFYFAFSVFQPFIVIITGWLIFIWLIYRENAEPENFGGDPLLILEWDDANLQARNITKNDVLEIIRRYPDGLTLFPGNGRTQLSSIVHIQDTPGVGAHQLIENIIGALQEQYLQRNAPRLREFL
ncbi:hypothetical protein RCL_jg13894.t1 [Rhizophagus clarus]|uniref:Uncharacterized protein n=1 Tax=Rhizophagus clarus TaxID=94130 RepID=A0A8H3LTL0_9GLOM|nr:hypothetical protein RCL_jg13894.t1 [Rhizophagus clarus]